MALASMMTDQTSDRVVGSQGTKANEIVVTAKRPVEEQRIDRRVYIIPNDAKSAAADGFAVLRGLPAINIGLDDTVQLLGSSNVTILVDNKRPPDGNAVLHTLRGADIDHIEVMTTPPADYATDGTGGIINIALRKRRRKGVSGAASAQADSFGGFEVNIARKYLSGRWSFDTQIVARRLVFKGSSENTRFLQEQIDSPVIGDRMDSAYNGKNYIGLFNETIGYKVDEQTTALISSSIGANHGATDSASAFTALTPDFQSFGLQQHLLFHYDYVGADVSVTRESDHKPGVQGESLRFNANINWVSQPQWTDAVIQTIPTDPAPYNLSDDRHRREIAVKLDKVHLLTGGRILSAGFAFSSTTLARVQSLSNPAYIDALGQPYNYRSKSGRSIAAAYTSFQQPLAAWTLLPALRLEFADFGSAPATSQNASIHQTSLSPSIRASSPIGEYVKLVLTYAHRIDRPTLEQLSPFTAVTGITSAFSGNPGLADQAVDAFETNVSYHRRNLIASAILYDRETSNSWTTSYSATPAGLTLTRPINYGHRSDRGLQVDLSTPIGYHLKISGSANLFASLLPIYNTVAPSSSSLFRATGNSTIGWSGPSRGKTPGDDLQLQLTYQSARREYQITYLPQFTGNLSWTHSFTNTLSMAANVDNVLGTRHTKDYIIASLDRETNDSRVIGPRFTFKLIRRLGS